MLHRRLFAGCLLVILLLAGCTSVTGGKPPTPTQRVESTTAAPTTTPIPHPNTPVTKARDLFPTTDLAATYIFQDKTQSQELLLPDGDRLVQTYNGEPFITWFFAPDGVLRPDPSDPKHRGLLRYLPATLKDDLTWEQYAVSDFYYFRLTHEQRCAGEGIAASDCWKLEVINYSGLTAFHFAPGQGVIAAQLTGYDATEDFTKRMETQGPANLTTADRAALLGRGLAYSQMQPVDPQMIHLNSGFEDMLQRLTQTPRCGTPATGPVLLGATGRVTFLCAGKIWSLDLATGQQRVLYAHATRIESFAWDPRGRGIALAVAPDRELWYWDASTQAVRHMHAGDDGLHPQWSPDGNILIADVGTSHWRGYFLIDPATGQELGSTNGSVLFWSPVSQRYAIERGVEIPQDQVETGSSRTLIVGDIHAGKTTERKVAEGNAQFGYEYAFFAADGTLVYRQFVPVKKTTVSWWALPPGPDAAPVKLDPASPLAKEATARAQAQPPQVNGHRIYERDKSPDGKWVLFPYNFFAEIYPIGADHSSPHVRLPGAEQEWDPRPQ